MTYTDVEEKLVYHHNKYKDDVLNHYYHNEPIYTLAYYDNILNKIESYFKRKVTILEFGCGSGMFMRRAIRAGHTIKGVDYSEYAGLAAKEFNLDIEVCEILDFNTKNQKYDVIISHATFEHLYNPMKITNALVKKLKKGGLFVNSGIPNGENMIINKLKNFCNHDPVEHVNFFSKSSIKKLYTNSGIKIFKLKAYGINIWFLLSMLKKHYNKNTTKSQNKDVKLKTDSIKSSYNTISPSSFHKFISKLYSHQQMPVLANSIEVWGVNL